MITSNNLGFQLRTQFTFIANDQTLACILSDIADNSVNIAGLSVTRSNNRNNFIRLVAGSSESENNRDLRVVSKTLDSLKVKYKDEKIIAISSIPEGVPGGYSNLYGSLWCKVEVKSFYEGENNTIFLTISDIKKAIAILSQENVKQCPNKCCLCDETSSL